MVPSQEWLEFEGGVISALFQRRESENRRWRADGDHAMQTDTTKSPGEAAEGTLFLGDDWFDPLEAGVRTRIRGFIEELLEAELDVALGRDRYERPRLAETGAGGKPIVKAGHRHGHRERQILGSFGPVTGRVRRARLDTSDGKAAEWKNKTIPAYQRRTKKAGALVGGAYHAGTNTR